MATAEQNTLLGLQLFQPAANVVSKYNDEKTALLVRLAEIQNQQRFQERMAGQQQQYGLQLEDLRAKNSRALAADAEQRQLAVTKQQQEAIDKRDLEKNFSLNYPIYAQAAAVIGVDPKAITEFDHSWAGLAELQGEMADLKEKASKHEKTEAAKGVVAVLDQSTRQLADAIRARDDAAKITDADQAQARNMGLQALQHAATTGAIPGLNPADKKFQTALTALSKDQPDVQVAAQIIGPAGIQAYTSGVQQGLLALQNDKERLARITSLSRDVQAAQRGASENLTRLMTLASTNPELGGMLSERATNLGALSKQSAAAPALDTTSVFKNMIGNPPPSGPPPPPPGSADTLPQQTGNPVLDAFSQQQRQQQQQGAGAALLSRLQALRAQQPGLQAQIQAPNVTPQNPAYPSVFTPSLAPQRFAAALQLAQNLQQQQSPDFAGLRGILGSGVQPQSGQVGGITPPLVPSVATPNFLFDNGAPPPDF